MIINSLDEADELATILVGVYQKLGEFSVLTRTTNDSHVVRIISPKVDVVKTSEFLRTCADVLFDGPSEATAIGRKN